MTEHTPEFLQPQLPFPQSGPNPSGLCMCGCGEKTNLAPASNAKTGNVRGQPLRYVRGHGRIVNTPESALWKNVTPGAVDECWLWRGCRYASGYGQAQIRKKRLGAHRLSWQLHYGEIPEGLWVLHKCDTPLCVNPHHLFLGTPKDNTRDMFAKDRDGSIFRKGISYPYQRGEVHHSAKATESIVRTIRERFAAGERIFMIARDFDLRYAIVRNIAKRKTWKHVE